MAVRELPSDPDPKLVVTGIILSRSGAKKGNNGKYEDRKLRYSDCPRRWSTRPPRVNSLGQRACHGQSIRSEWTDQTCLARTLGGMECFVSLTKQMAKICLPPSVRSPRHRNKQQAKLWTEFCSRENLHLLTIGETRRYHKCALFLRLFREF